jgi:hypothetical protein
MRQDENRRWTWRAVWRTAWVLALAGAAWMAAAAPIIIGGGG